MKEFTKQTIKKNIKDLLSYDKNRLYELLGMIQYTILYIVFTMIFAHLIDVIFFDQYEDIKKENIFKILFDIILQVILCVIAIFYIKKIVRIFPFFLNQKYHVSQYNEEIVISFVFIASQQNLLKKIDYVMSVADKNFFD